MVLTFFKQTGIDARVSFQIVISSKREFNCFLFRIPKRFKESEKNAPDSYRVHTSLNEFQDNQFVIRRILRGSLRIRRHPIQSEQNFLKLQTT